jgi:hypothetical protein
VTVRVRRWAAAVLGTAGALLLVVAVLQFAAFTFLAAREAHPKAASTSSVEAAARCRVVPGEPVTEAQAGCLGAPARRVARWALVPLAMGLVSIGVAVVLVARRGGAEAPSEEPEGP